VRRRSDARHLPVRSRGLPERQRPESPDLRAASLETYFIENEQPDTNPKHDFDFQALEDALNSSCCRSTRAI
jgi:hypothetical protein